MPMKNLGGDQYVIPSNVPAFLVKLWKLVEDHQYDIHISWNRSGSGFLVHDQATFAREILPKYFKHNNFASFVRQLNMYGFRKVIGAEQGGLRSDNDVWEFHNPNFQCGQPQLLENVKRKATPDERKLKNEDVTKVLNDVQDMKGKQDEMTAKLEQMKRENETLWRELVDLRTKHSRQQHVVNRLFQFLMRLVYQNEARLANRKRLMLQDSSEQEQAAKRARQEYSMDSHTATSTSTSHGYGSAVPGSNTQSLTISDVSNTPNEMQSSSGPLITALPDDDEAIRNRVMSSQRPVIVLRDNKKMNTASQPTVTSPVSTQASSFGYSPGSQMIHSSGPSSYSHSSGSQPPAYTTGVVTFPEEHQQQQQQPSIIHPSHIMEPGQYSEQQSSARRGTGPIRQFSEEDILDSRNFLGEHIDYISSNLDSLQQVLANQQNFMDVQGFSEILNSSEGLSNLASQQDLLDAIAERAAPSPGPTSQQQGQEIVQYGQSLGNPQRQLRQHELPGYGRKTMPWSQGSTQSGQQYEEGDPRNHYEVQDLFNG
ncbi:heat shock factor protein-like isoform X2 [Actinia tenebrosa]|uniref:Heat shock factor protein-like isoform X2 n=1 Tax=Actinia tenebrosa TaxID=6105 RepID=A0A6P8IVW3_ACTTE|nr:heat shock factor protein-like isoform X2 [Actinia tenebrosa]